MVRWFGKFCRIRGGRAVGPPGLPGNPFSVSWRGSTARTNRVLNRGEEQPRARRDPSCPPPPRRYHQDMGASIHEIEAAVRTLSRHDLAAFRDWFSEFDATVWDKQFETDVSAGSLDSLADEALRDFREGRSRKL